MPVHEGVLSSGAVAASAQVSSTGQAALLYGYILIGGTTASSVTFNDGGSSGTAKWKDSIAAQTNVGDATASVTFDYPIVFTNDIYATLAGTNASVYVLYIPIE